MAQDYLDLIVRISVFMICARMLLHLRVKASDEKYLKGIVGLMIVSFMVISMVTRWKDNEVAGGILNINEIERQIEEKIRYEIYKGKILDTHINEIKEKNYMNAIDKIKMQEDERGNNKLPDERNEENGKRENRSIDNISIIVGTTSAMLGKDSE